MFQVHSVTLQGKENRLVQFRRSDTGVMLRLPITDISVYVLKPDSLPGDIVNIVLPLLYGDPVNGKFDCTDEDLRKIVSEIERLF